MAHGHVWLGCVHGWGACMAWGAGAPLPHRAVGKRAVSMLLECCLVNVLFTVALNILDNTSMVSCFCFVISVYSNQNTEEMADAVVFHLRYNYLDGQKYGKRSHPKSMWQKVSGHQR